MRGMFMPFEQTSSETFAKLKFTPALNMQNAEQVVEQLQQVGFSNVQVHNLQALVSLTKKEYLRIGKPILIHMKPELGKLFEKVVHYGPVTTHLDTNANLFIVQK